LTYLREEDKKELTEIFNERLLNDVAIRLFVGDECRECGDAKEMLEELSSLSEKISVTVRNVDESPVPGVEMTPAIELTKNLRFYGLPIMNEFSSLIEGIILISTGESGIDDCIIDDLKTASGDVKLFVTPYCVFCPEAIDVLTSFAVENEKIFVEIFSIETFPKLEEQYKIKGTPTIISNGCRIDCEVPDEIMLLNMLAGKR